MKRAARWLRLLADRIDHAGAPKLISWSFTFEQHQGIVFRQDGRGCPLAYLGDDDYDRAHAEAGSGLRPCCGTPPGGGHGNDSPGWKSGGTGGPTVYVPLRGPLR